MSLLATVSTWVILKKMDKNSKMAKMGQNGQNVKNDEKTRFLTNLTPFLTKITKMTKNVKFEHLPIIYRPRIMTYDGHEKHENGGSKSGNHGFFHVLKNGHSGSD